MAKRSVTIGLVQMSCEADPEVNLAKVLERIRQAAAAGARIVATQELFRSYYFCQEENAENFDLAEPIPGPSSEALGALARELEIVIVGSLFERRAAGLYHNSAVVLDADGSLAGVYRKMHIPDDPLYYEKFYFTPGDLGFRVFETRYAKIAPLVCWDQWYPEAARLAALAGAEILIYPTAIGYHPSEKAEWGEKAARRLAHHPALPRGRQRRLRRGRQPRGAREADRRGSRAGRAATMGSSSGAARSSAARWATCSPKPARKSKSSPSSATWTASKKPDAAGRSCATAASTPTRGCSSATSTLLLPDRIAKPGELCFHGAVSCNGKRSPMQRWAS